MTFQQLRTFLWVARLGGVRKAADQMNLSQPAVSARISALEESLRAALFERSPAGVRLTKRGEMLLKYAEQICQVAENIQKEIVDPAGLEAHLRVGVSETIVQSWLPEFVSRLSEDYPRLSLELTVDISLNLREALLGRSLDLAILMGPISEYSVNNIDLPAFDLCWYHAAGAEPEADVETMLMTSPVITYARNTRPHRELKAALVGRYGPQVRLFPSSSLSACFRMVAAGLGVGALPSALAGPDLEAKRIVEFDPGWRPDALCFTASYVGEPHSFVAERAAQIARKVATAYRQ